MPGFSIGLGYGSSPPLIGTAPKGLREITSSALTKVAEILERSVTGKVPASERERIMREAEEQIRMASGNNASLAFDSIARMRREVGSVLRQSDEQADRESFLGIRLPSESVARWANYAAIGGAILVAGVIALRVLGK